MKELLHSRSLYVIGVIVIIAIVVAMMLGVGGNKQTEFITTTVELGTVQQLVSVSGIAEAEQTAELAFPVSGIVKSVAVTEGDVVNEGDVLVTLTSQGLEADRQDALASLARAVADRDELLAGQSDSERVITTESLNLATNALATTKENEARKIENAQRALRSSGLTAFSDDVNEQAAPPAISGTYTCEEEGVYIIDVFSSAAQSGFSYRLSGLESGTFTASTEQAVPLGTCGLRIQFANDVSYNLSTWTVEIPNTKSSNYTNLLNTYNLAVTQAASAITVAEQEVELAEANATNDNAPARIEAVARANADVAQAQARVARIEANLEDRTLRAPFSGTVTEIDILPGETVNTAPVITILAASDFEVTARIPEIDIGKLLVGQTVEMTFDARDEVMLSGTIDFISLKATEIDGVAYYEALIAMNEVPEWMRSGLNADIEIVIEEERDALKVPKRFVTNTEGVYSVQYTDGETVASTTVKILLEGNDGFYALTGLNKGDTLVAPE